MTGPRKLDCPNRRATPNHAFAESIARVDNILALETENAQLKREIERLREPSDLRVTNLRAVYLDPEVLACLFEPEKPWPAMRSNGKLAHSKVTTRSFPEFGTTIRYVPDGGTASDAADANARAMDLQTQLASSRYEASEFQRRINEELNPALIELNQQRIERSGLNLALRKQQKEIETLRESEAKAWGLVAAILLANKEHEENSDALSLGAALSDACDALAARKAGA
jgi:hypothetical protein